ncbi:hypothetical protein TRIUR3_31544 [Triticum urartu]|uniref:Uncharacterized protein n=1 Tax=Triticum urartu TaxID=4572 RepID=M7Z9M2_TRIUA|nr:hypothetical protein TRIUR3_31544 [Triticum urartu]
MRGTWHFRRDTLDIGDGRRSHSFGELLGDSQVLRGHRVVVYVAVGLDAKHTGRRGTRSGEGGDTAGGGRRGRRRRGREETKQRTGRPEELLRELGTELVACEAAEETHIRDEEAGASDARRPKARVSGFLPCAVVAGARAFLEKKQ